MGKRIIKAIIFDLGQTLVDSSKGFRTAEKEVQKKIFHELDLESWDDFILNYRKIRKEFQYSNNVVRKVMWGKIYSEYNRKPHSKLLEKWEDHYWNVVQSLTEPFPEAETVLDKLVYDYKLALITNITGLGKRCLHDFPELEKFFKTIVFAGECNVPLKPDKKPFFLCLENLSINPGEALYVGDDFYIDICGANNAGIQPIWLKHNLVERNWLAVETVVPTISSLYQLLDLKALLKREYL